MIWLLMLTAAVADLPKSPIPMPPGELLAEIVTSPPYGDWNRFPPRPFVSQARQANCTFRSKMEKEREQWPPAMQRPFDEAIRYAEWSYKVYDCLDDAHQDWRTWWDRRIKMKQLRELIGEEAYRNAEMPDPLPTWLFRELR